MISNTSEGTKFESESTMMIALYETHEELNRLFNDPFMRKYTNFASFDEYKFSTAVFINWNTDFVVGDRNAFDSSVQGKTTFSTWNEMYEKARAELK